MRKVVPARCYRPDGVLWGGWRCQRPNGRIPCKEETAGSTLSKGSRLSLGAPPKGQIFFSILCQKVFPFLMDVCPKRGPKSLFFASLRGGKIPFWQLAIPFDAPPHQIAGSRPPLGFLSKPPEPCSQRFFSKKASPMKTNPTKTHHLCSKNTTY